MEKISAGDFQRNFSLYQDMALTKPVTITKHGNERLVLTSYASYKDLCERVRRSLKSADLSESDLRAIENAMVPSDYNYLDDELSE